MNQKGEICELLQGINLHAGVFHFAKILTLEERVYLTSVIIKESPINRPKKKNIPAKIHNISPKENQIMIVPINSRKNNHTKCQQ